MLWKLDLLRDRDSWCWPEGARLLGTRMAQSGNSYSPQLRTLTNTYNTTNESQWCLSHLNRELKHEDFSGDAAVIWAVETGTRSIVHDIPRTADVVLPATTRVEWIWRRSESREWFKRILTFLSFVLLPVLVDRFQSMLHLLFLNSLSLIALTDQAEMTTEPCRRKCKETRWA